jgi:hypothetical protein
MQRVEGSERRLYRREITLEGQDLGPMGLNESRDHFVPARCGQGLAGDEDSVSIGPKRSCWEEGGRQEEGEEQTAHAAGCVRVLEVKSRKGCMDMLG